MTQPEVEPAFGVPHHVRMLRAVRKRYGWSQAQLAQQLQVSQRTVLRWENAHREPPGYLLAALRELLNSAQS